MYYLRAPRSLRLARCATMRGCRLAGRRLVNRLRERKKHDDVERRHCRGRSFFALMMHAARFISNTRCTARRFALYPYNAYIYIGAAPMQPSARFSSSGQAARAARPPLSRSVAPTPRRRRRRRSKSHNGAGHGVAGVSQSRPPLEIFPTVSLSA